MRWKVNWSGGWVLREPVFANKELSTDAKLNVYNAEVIPTLVYGCEAWVWKAGAR